MVIITVFLLTWQIRCCFTVVILTPLLHFPPSITEHRSHCLSPMRHECLKVDLTQVPRGVWGTGYRQEQHWQRYSSLHYTRSAPEALSNTSTQNGTVRDNERHLDPFLLSALILQRGFCLLCSVGTSITRQRDGEQHATFPAHYWACNPSTYHCYMQKVIFLA